MFSGLTKLADKAFILGFFLPALLGVLTFLRLHADIIPSGMRISLTSSDKTFGNLTVLLLGVWTLAVLLMVGNHWMYRVLEGYAWPWNGTRFRSGELLRRHDLVTRQSDAFDAYDLASRTLTLAQRNHRHATEIETLERACKQKLYTYLSLKRELVADFPNDDLLILPTRLGNVIRSFELYPAVIYEVESISTWPRLLGVVPKEYQAALSDTKSQVDFFVSLTFVSVGLGVASLARGANDLIAKGAWSNPVFLFVGSGVALLILGRVFYLAAIPSARAWGEVVKSSFDLYLPALASQLGYPLPKTSEKKAALWQEFASQFEFAERADETAWDEPPPDPFWKKIPTLFSTFCDWLK